MSSRWNLAPDPRAVETPTTGPFGGSDGWMTTRYFGGLGAAGNYSWMPSDANPAPPGIASMIRKYWSTGMSASGSVSTAGVEMRAGFGLFFDVRAWQGRTVTASLYARCSGIPGTGMRMSAIFYAAPSTASAQVGTQAYGPTVPFNAGWTFCRPWGAFTVPAGAGGMRLFADPVGSGQINAGALIDYTGLLIEPDTSAAGVYFDGSTAGSASVGYSWTGLANASPSVAALSTTGPDGTVFATCEVYVDGLRIADGQPGENPAAPFALSGLTLRWGRDNTLDQPAPSQVTFRVADPPGAPRFDEVLRLGSTLTVWSQVDTKRVGVFAGRITDLDVTFDDDIGMAQVGVAAADIMADIANRFVGVEPWAAEASWLRAVRIWTAIGLPTDIAYLPAPGGALNVSKMDVDRQPGAALVTELATSTGFVVTAALDPTAGVRIRFEDPAMRPGQIRFVKGGNNLWAPSAAASGGVLDACDLDRDPVHWLRDPVDTLTRVTVRWLDQASNPPTERSVLASDTAAETAHGARGASIGTILTTSGDAQNRANAVLAGHPTTQLWRLEGLRLDLDDTEADDRGLVAALLNSLTRGGTPVSLVNLPAWTPTAVDLGLYVEGGSYQFVDGRWRLALSTSSPAGQGHSMTFAETNRTVRYADIDPSVSFLSMIGVSA